MSTAELREDLHQQIDRLDERFLRVMLAMVNAYQEEKESEPAIVGYDIDGTPRTATELEAILDRQVEEGLKGAYTTLEDLRKESDTWLKSTK